MGGDLGASEVLARARARGVSIATAESCTGGLLAAALTDIPGASEVFERGFVTYSNLSKETLLDVPGDLIAAHGAVSEAVAEAMARGAVQRSPAALAVSITGVAGPGGTERKPEGMVCFGFANTLAGKLLVTSETRHFGTVGRSKIRQLSVVHALFQLAELLAEPAFGP